MIKIIHDFHEFKKWIIVISAHRYELQMNNNYAAIQMFVFVIVERKRPFWGFFSDFEAPHIADA